MSGPDLEEIERLRWEATEAVVNSGADKRLIVAGPGTGKTYTFKKALAKAIVDSGRADKGLALTFIRNLVADLLHFTTATGRYLLARTRS
jgi:superfamily II DNA or RNA helicase